MASYLCSKLPRTRQTSLYPRAHALGVPVFMATGPGNLQGRRVSPLDSNSTSISSMLAAATNRSYALIPAALCLSEKNEAREIFRMSLSNLKNLYSLWSRIDFKFREMGTMKEELDAIEQTHRHTHKRVIYTAKEVREFGKRVEDLAKKVRLLEQSTEKLLERGQDAARKRLLEIEEREKELRQLLATQKQNNFSSFLILEIKDSIRRLLEQFISIFPGKSNP